MKNGKMRNILRSGLFVIAFFLLGSINVLYNTFFYVFVILAFLVNVVMDWRGFQVNMRKEWRYWCLPLLFSVYVFSHYLSSLILIRSSSCTYLELSMITCSFFPIPSIATRSSFLSNTSTSLLTARVSIPITVSLSFTT